LLPGLVAYSNIKLHKIWIPYAITNHHPIHPIGKTNEAVNENGMGESLDIFLRKDRSTMTTPHVLLLVSGQDQASSKTEALCEALYEKFGMRQVIVRSATAPADRLLSASTGESGNPVLYVVLGPSTPSTAVLERESAFPVLWLDATALSDPIAAALQIAKFCSLASPELRATVAKAVFSSRQACLVEDAQWRTQSAPYAVAIASCYDNQMQITGDNVAVQGRLRGKVRDIYFSPNQKNVLALVTTDRQSGFDRQLAQVPYKGAVLNLTSAFWFEATNHIIPNHLLSVPHPYVSIVRKCKPFPIEFVMRYVYSK
jgi:hypothetical protein